MIKNIFLLLDYTYEGKEMNAVYIFGMALMIIRIVVPILLIVVASIDLVRTLVQDDNIERKKIIKSLIPKLIAVVVIFMLAPFALLITKITNKYAETATYYTCLLKPTACEVELWQEPPLIFENPLGEGTIVIKKNKNGVYLPTDEYLTDEFLQALESGKLKSFYAVNGLDQDNSSGEDHSLLEKNTSGSTLNSKKNKTQFPVPITYNNQVDVEEFNQTIGDINRKYGFRSRDALLEMMQATLDINDQYSLPYELDGAYYRNADINNFLGLNPNLGSPTGNEEYPYVGMNCRSSVVWLYAQNGVPLIRGLVLDGEGKKYSDMRDVQPGDVMDSREHIMVVMDKYEDEQGGGVITWEFAPHVGNYSRVISYDALKALGYSAYDMTETIEGTNEHINNNLKNNPFSGLSLIYNDEDPTEVSPEFLEAWQDVYGELPSNYKSNQQYESQTVKPIRDTNEQYSTPTYINPEREIINYEGVTPKETPSSQIEENESFINKVNIGKETTSSKNEQPSSSQVEEEKKETFFEKIKNFFKKLFSKKNY